MPDALIVSGAGPYADAWHDFAATSARLAGIVEDAGGGVTVTEDVEGALADPSDARLLVVRSRTADRRPTTHPAASRHSTSGR